MPKIDISETFDIPYDSLSNEQRLAIKLLMEGNALKNPVEEKVKKTKVGSGLASRIRSIGLQK